MLSLSMGLSVVAVPRGGRDVADPSRPARQKPDTKARIWLLRVQLCWRSVGEVENRR